MTNGAQSNFALYIRPLPCTFIYLFINKLNVCQDLAYDVWWLLQTDDENRCFLQLTELWRPFTTVFVLIYDFYLINDSPNYVDGGKVRSNKFFVLMSFVANGKWGTLAVNVGVEQKNDFKSCFSPLIGVSAKIYNK